MPARQELLCDFVNALRRRAAEAPQRDLENYWIPHRCIESRGTFLHFADNHVGPIDGVCEDAVWR